MDDNDKVAFERPITLLEKVKKLLRVREEEILELKKTKKELEAAKTELEIKVEARTKELKELTEWQEEIIKERTKELQEKINELQKFQRLTVGRELKMTELKREIKRLTDQLKSKG